MILSRTVFTGPQLRGTGGTLFQAGMGPETQCLLPTRKLREFQFGLASRIVNGNQCLRTMVY